SIRNYLFGEIFAPPFPFRVLGEKARITFRPYLRDPLNCNPPIYRPPFVLISFYLFDNSSRASVILHLAISQYSSSCSMPMKLRPVLIAATAVVPEPMTLSKTVSLSFVYVRMRYSNRATGFCVGCLTNSLELGRKELNFNTVLGFF